MKVSIIYLNTFILGCGPSLVVDRPDRSVDVLYESFYKSLKYFHSWLWAKSGHGQTRSARGRYMKSYSYCHNKRCCLPTVFLLLIFFAFAVSPVFAGPLKVKTGGEGTRVEAESIRPHDYTLVAKNIPCVYHFFSENMERMKFTAEQKKTLKAIDNSPEERALYSRAEKIQALEFTLRKAVYSNNIKPEDVKIKLREIGRLRLEQTMGFIEMQSRLLNMLSPDQYNELKTIITEKGLL